MREDNNLKVIHIVGSGRSGSTLLDIILGSHTDAVSGGELINAFSAVENFDEYCACGRAARNCEFWIDVFENWASGNGKDWQIEITKLKNKYESLLSTPVLLLSKLFKTKDYLRYQTLHKRFYQSIAEVSGKNIIIDSSKNPLRAYVLMDIAGIKPVVIHLIRDGRAVANSLLKSFQKDPESGVQKDLKPKPISRTAVFWVILNLLTEWLIANQQSASYRMIRYEDLMTDFKKEMDRLGEVISLDYSEIGNMVTTGKKLEIGHLIAGNRLRMADYVTLAPDYSWRESLSNRQKAIFWLIAGITARRYGYRKGEM